MASERNAGRLAIQGKNTLHHVPDQNMSTLSDLGVSRKESAARLWPPNSPRCPMTNSTHAEGRFIDPSASARPT
jgi:hypothetical protein